MSLTVVGSIAYDAVKTPTGKDFAALALLHAGQSASQLKKWDEASKQLGEHSERLVLAYTVEKLP